MLLLKNVCLHLLELVLLLVPYQGLEVLGGEEDADELLGALDLWVVDCHQVLSEVLVLFYWAIDHGVVLGEVIAMLKALKEINASLLLDDLR